MANAIAEPPNGIVLHINLSLLEAQELKAMLQNPLSQDESATAAEVRLAIFMALTRAGVQL